MEQKGNIDGMSDELRYLRSEFIKTIEYIKNRMLKFLYYGSILQAGIIAYHTSLYKKYVSLPFNIYLILISLLIASGTMFFIMKYHRDYKYCLYRYDIYIDPEFSYIAKRSLDVPYFKFSKTDDNIREYFKFFIKEPFQILYLLFNWGICLFVIIHLCLPLARKISINMPIVLWINGSVLIFWGIVIFIAVLIFIGITTTIFCKLRKQTKNMLLKHEDYLRVIEKKHNISRIEIEKKLTE